MKSIIKITGFATLMAGMICMVSCQKDDSKIAYGTSNIYMPQALNRSGGINNNYPVPSGTDSTTNNYSLDSVNHKINVILGVSCSGMQSAEGFSVSIITRSDTIGQLIATKVFDTSTILMPAAMYSLPTSVSVNAGATSATFNLVLDIAQLKLYPKKKLALAVVLSNPTKYQLNTAINTTIVIVDVDAMVIGPAVNVTNKYILNPGSPFTASSVNGRWGSLNNWTANASALSHGGLGGYATDNSGTIDLESGWGSPAILNGKLYQTITLPAGTYTFDASPTPWNWQGTLDPAYVVVAPNSATLPDYSTIVGNTSVWYALFAVRRITFQLTATTQVTVGFVVNYVKDQQGFRTNGVALFNYPKHL